jgi:Holliday junction resolvasome RuvABC endonuclease subunit
MSTVSLTTHHSLPSSNVRGTPFAAFSWRRVVTTRRVTRRSRSASLPAVPAGSSDLYVGIDASLTGYGVVLWWPSGGAHREVLISTKAAGDSYAARLVQIRDTGAGLRMPEKEHIRLICMERPAYAASGAFTGGLVHAATAFALADVFGLDTPLVAPVLVASNTLKKFVTGRGVGQKQLMVKYVYTKWGFDTDDDNLADAYGLARLAAAVASRTSEHQYERDCIDTVRRSMTWEPLPPQQTPLRPRPPGRASTSSKTRTRKSSSVSATAATSSN